MPVSMTLDAGDPGVLELFAEPRTLRTWEFIRISKSAATISDLVAAIGTERAEVHRQVDSLVAQGLLRVLRARKPRREFGYRATCDQIIVSFDDHDEEVVARLIATGDAVDRDYIDCVERHADPEFHSQAGFRFRMSGMYQLSQEELAELRRRVLAVVSFLNMPKKGGQKSKLGSTGADEPQGCNQAISITLDPLVGGLIPSPTIITSPRSKLDQWDGSKADAAGLPGLTPREREVALALADGLSRAQVADRLQLSVHTISTFARRAYRKLGVTSQAELTARLTGHDREVPGDSTSEPFWQARE
jgi:DNA-binding CsgD family transcriptional regulator/DNA-binding MarR family transcriptional regulator